MTIAQPVFPGFVHFLSRSVVEQRFWLTPVRKIANAYRYTLGASLLHFEGRIRLHAGCQMSNHDHLVVTDDLGERTQFLNRRNALLARCLNRIHERKGRLFGNPNYKEKEHLFTARSVLGTVVYTLCNPVRAGLCDWPHEWPGTIGDWRQILTVPIVESKPSRFYSQASPDQGGQVDEVLFYLAQPKCFDHLEPDEYEELIRETVREECREIHAARSGPPLGVRAALATPPESRPREPNREVERDYRRWRGDPEQVQLFLQAWIAWVSAYIEARERWMAGARKGVIFPPGTDAYHHLEHAPREDLPPDSPFQFQDP